jgi:hypothetical protein
MRQAAELADHMGRAWNYVAQNRGRAVADAEEDQE